MPLRRNGVTGSERERENFRMNRKPNRNQEITDKLLLLFNRRRKYVNRATGDHV